MQGVLPSPLLNSLSFCPLSHPSPPPTMDAAAVPANGNAFPSAVTRYKLHIIAAFLCAASGAYYAGPNFVSVLAYFWPLLLSTALFLAAIVFFGKASPSDLADGAGSEIMEYVAGGPHEMEAVGSEGEVASTSASQPQRPTQ